MTRQVSGGIGLGALTDERDWKAVTEAALTFRDVPTDIVVTLNRLSWPGPGASDVVTRRDYGGSCPVG